MKRAGAWPWVRPAWSLASSSGRARPPGPRDSKVLAGCWEGKGATFWFACDKQLRCRGEATTTYAADLQAVKWSIPLPSGAIVHDVVRNQGPADAGPFAVTFYLSRDAVLDGTDIPFCSRTVPGLEGGGTGAAAAVSEARTTCAWPAGATGSYHVIVVIDAVNAVLEASETNNQRATAAIRRP